LPARNSGAGKEKRGKGKRGEKGALSQFIRDHVVAVRRASENDRSSRSTEKREKSLSDSYVRDRPAAGGEGRVMCVLLSVEKEKRKRENSRASPLRRVLERSSLVATRSRKREGKKSEEPMKGATAGGGKAAGRPLSAAERWKEKGNEARNYVYHYSVRSSPSSFWTPPLREERRRARILH